MNRETDSPTEQGTEDQDRFSWHESGRLFSDKPLAHLSHGGHHSLVPNAASMRLLSAFGTKRMLVGVSRLGEIALRPVKEGGFAVSGRYFHIVTAAFKHLPAGHYALTEQTDDTLIFSRITNNEDGVTPKEELR